ncbi:antitoxin VbhA family protein [Oerskovia sp. Sa1BUA8]|uniref:Antitoxin VbhA family protein n=1 Tax=Oerskovia douganii TaxID=2762210 RepID=A0A9D5UGC1_9CELL|nr:antitoxin VbhA family protein [Oerskovia douganii]MBE7700047.1 antitoxin VbhA family protein [Oerskovia douganii]
MTVTPHHDLNQGMTRERRRDLAIDTMASWAMEGMEPDERSLDSIRGYVDGKLTIADLLERARAR